MLFRLKWNDWMVWEQTRKCWHRKSIQTMIFQIVLSKTQLNLSPLDCLTLTVTVVYPAKQFLLCFNVNMRTKKIIDEFCSYNIIDQHFQIIHAHENQKLKVHCKNKVNVANNSTLQKFQFHCWILLKFFP